MAKVKKEDTETIEAEAPEEQALKFLKSHKEDHFNFEPIKDLQISSGSLLLDLATGPLRNQVCRMLGSREAGKSSASMSYMKNFLEPAVKRRGIYVKAEGRLSPEIQERSGINFVFNPKDWKDGTCFVFESNVYEAVFGFIKDLVKNNPTDTTYFFIVDSMDALCLREDFEKPFEESNKVAGGALMTSTFFKKMGLALTRRGHIIMLISQNREFIKIDPRTKVPQRQGSSSGGNSVQHVADWAFEFKNRTKDDLILDSQDKIIGHYCRVEFLKSPNEKTGVTVRYPVKYGQKDGTSIWREYEVVDILLTFSLIKKDGNSYTFDESIVEELKKINLELPEKLVGENKLYSFFVKQTEISQYLYDKVCKNLL